MKHKERKKGENEAILILKNLGYSFNENFVDYGDTSEHHPDLQYVDGRYLEVTHTPHCHAAWDNIVRNASGKTIQEMYQEVKSQSELLERLNHPREFYEYINIFEMSKKGLDDYRRDLNLKEKIFGKLNIKTMKRSENCINPIICYSAANILEAIENKWKKYTRDNQLTFDMDLFIFADKEECGHLIQELEELGLWTSNKRSLKKYKFKNIFICSFDFMTEKDKQYDLKNPLVIKLTRNETDYDFTYLNGENLIERVDIGYETIVRIKE